MAWELVSGMGKAESVTAQERTEVNAIDGLPG
jgi:hypothetical protein